MILEKQGIHVTLANNGKEALAARERENFDVILMDVQMPEMDGFEAAAAFRQREKDTLGPHQIVIAMTAHAIAGDREFCLRAGMDGYVAKPFRLGELLHEIEMFTGTPAATRSHGLRYAASARRRGTFSFAVGFQNGNCDCRACCRHLTQEPAASRRQTSPSRSFHCLTKALIARVGSTTKIQHWATPEVQMGDCAAKSLTLSAGLLTSGSREYTAIVAEPGPKSGGQRTWASL